MNLFYFLFPQNCLLCGRDLFREPYTRGICRECCKSLLSSPQKTCQVCGLPLISEQDLCLKCREQKHQFIHHKSLLSYQDKGAYLLKLYKFKNHKYLGHYFADIICDEVLKNYPDFTLVCAPANPLSVKKRGWDQVEYLTLFFPNEISVCPKVFKRLPGESQKKLNKEERKKNLEGRISIIRNNLPDKILLIDDVYTTGATMDFLSALLREKGITEIYSLTLMRD